MAKPKTFEERMGDVISGLPGAEGLDGERRNVYEELPVMGTVQDTEETVVDVLTAGDLQKKFPHLG